jgi:carboxyl-terminal processing protease
MRWFAHRRRASAALGLAAVALASVLGASSRAAPKGDDTLAAGPAHGPSADAWGGYDSWRSRPQEPFQGGAAAFEDVRRTLLEKYVQAGLTEDDLYRAAVAGMLANVDPDRSAWNKLLSPRERAELAEDIAGKVVGIGVEIGFREETGVADVKSVIPGTPGARAGIERGDQILKIDGVGFRGRQLRDVVYAIRGKPGTGVTLTVLHDAALREVKLTRAALTWDTVESRMLTGGYALLTVRYFTHTTAAATAAALRKLDRGKLRGVIVDLRGNEGGLLEAALATASHFVPHGEPLVRSRGRDGEAEVLRADGQALVTGVPLVVLVNNVTKSGAEMVASALKQGADATLVGTRTFGKWSSQRVDELPNGYAIKYTTMLFTAGDGQEFGGVGVPPDIAVELAPEAVRGLQCEPDEAKRLAGDPQLAAAVNVLKLRDE